MKVYVLVSVEVATDDYTIATSVVDDANFRVFLTNEENEEETDLEVSVLEYSEVYPN